ncbi:MAG: LysR family transcriptional regulator [Halopseudomonas sp.]
MIHKKGNIAVILFTFGYHVFMTYEQLKMLMAVVETGSFRKAAGVVFKSQAAVSKAIKGLESELNIPLFSRDTYRPLLTKKGRAFYQKSKEVVEQFDDLLDFGRELSLGYEPEVDIAINAICATPQLLSLIKTLDDKYPRTQLNLSIENLGVPMDRLKQGKVDFAITRILEPDPELESIDLFDVKLLTVARHDLEPVRQKERSQQLMKKYSQIIVRDDAGWGEKLSISLLPGGRSWEVNDLFSKKEVIVAGLGWGQLPEHLISEELRAKTLVPINIEGFPHQNIRRMSLIKKRAVRLGPVAQQLWDSASCMGALGHSDHP